MRRRVLLALMAVSLLGLPVAASAVTIDDFSTQQVAELGFGEDGPVNSSVAAPEAIGGARDIQLQRENVGQSFGTASADSSLSNPGLFSLSTGAAVQATAQIVYDGSADGTTDFNGLGGASLIGAGESILRIIARSDLEGTIRVQIHSGSETDYAFVDVAVPGAGTGNGPLVPIDIPLSSLSTQGAGADLGNVGAIQVFLSGPASIDMQIDSISTLVPEPASTALMGLGLLGLTLAGRRRS